MKNNIQTIQDLIDLVNNLAIKNRKENGIYNVTLASLLGILAMEIERVNEFLEEQGYQTLEKWELLSTKTIYLELENSHQAINLSEILGVKNVDERKN